MPEHSVESQLLRHEPIWRHGLARTFHCLERTDVHWVPVLSSDDFVIVLVLGSPRPSAMILPRVVTPSFLVRVLRRIFDHVQGVAGRHVSLHDPNSVTKDFALCPGDVLDIRTCEWVPTLIPARPQHFGSVSDARDFGFWSHPLSFEGVGHAILRSPVTEAVDTLTLYGRQVWDPLAGTLYPDFQEIVDSWWPDPAQPRGSGSIIDPFHTPGCCGLEGTPSVFLRGCRSCCCASDIQSSHYS